MAGIFGVRQGKRRIAGKGSPGVIAAGLFGVAGVGWLVAGSFRGGASPDPLPLSTPAVAVAAPGDAATPQDGLPGAAPRAPAATQVPPALLEAYGRVGSDPFSLPDLRQVALAYGGTPEADQARAALDAEAARAAAAWKELEQAGRFEDALAEATRQWLATVDRAARRALRAPVQALAERVLFGPTPPSTITVYTVAKGDSLTRVADAHKTDFRLVQRLSKLSNDRLKVGQKLRVPQAPITVVAFKRDFEVAVLLGGHLVRVWDVATGKDGKTPEATFTIGNKLVNPDWYSPDGKVFKFGHPENILGTRWLAFEDTPEHKGFGIHGTKFPESIGTEASMGCLRMRNEEVEELYDWVPKGTTVHLVR